MRLIRHTAAAVAAIALSGGLLAASPALAAPAPAPAAAVDRGATWHCTKGGFTGYVYVNYTRRAGSADRVNWVQYKITKGGNSGGNKADVVWGDGGVAPRLVYKTNRGVQDGRWHRLGGSYHRGSGAYGFSFIFDKSHAGDPRCNKALGTRLP